MEQCDLQRAFADLARKHLDNMAANYKHNKACSEDQIFPRALSSAAASVSNIGAQGLNKAPVMGIGIFFTQQFIKLRSACKEFLVPVGEYNNLMSMWGQITAQGGPWQCGDTRADQCEELANRCEERQRGLINPTEACGEVYDDCIGKRR